MLITLLVFLPLFGFLVNGAIALGSKADSKHPPAVLTGAIATLAMAGSFVLALVLNAKLRALGGEPMAIEESLFSWIRLGTHSVDFGFRFDRLSAAFTLVITGVGSLIHLYSIGYMSHDSGVARYFAYLNLFCFMMLNLVLGQTLPHVFLGWEGVGLASYLLIGFWFRDGEKVRAGQKAFVMNRIGDLGFLLAMFVGFHAVGTLDAVALGQSVMAPKLAMLFGVLIFLACTGKSAQLPLFTWLPDAMAGPTPVSALIHAATMVTSGVYLLARLQPVIAGSPATIALIGGVGAATALIAAILACFQSDIKKILAYSTISQLGFMFAACGVGAFESGVFHVMTHAFFKALLFLGAGSVIHALSGNQDIFRMGGLRKSLPFTFWTFSAGWAAILGLPPFSGFFSKDEIIHDALVSRHGSLVLSGVLLFSALLTAFYMTRLYVLVFFGDSRLSAKEKAHVHESPFVMTIPLMVLAGASLAGGWFGAPVELASYEKAVRAPASAHTLVMVLSVAAALIGAFVARARYSRNTDSEPVLDPFRIDRFYGQVFGRGVYRLSDAIGRVLEETLVQGFLRGTAAIVDLSGNLIRTVQTGSAQTYLLMMVLAVAAVVSWIFFGVTGYGKF